MKNKSKKEMKKEEEKRNVVIKFPWRRWFI